MSKYVPYPNIFNIFLALKHRACQSPASFLASIHILYNGIKYVYQILVAIGD